MQQLQLQEGFPEDPADTNSYEPFKNNTTKVDRVGQLTTMEHLAIR